MWAFSQHVLLKQPPPPGKVLSVAPVGGYYGMFRRLYILHTLSLVECFAVWQGTHSIFTTAWSTAYDVTRFHNGLYKVLTRYHWKSVSINGVALSFFLQWVLAFEIFIPLVLFFILLGLRQKKPAIPVKEGRPSIVMSTSFYVILTSSYSYLFCPPESWVLI